MRNEKELHEKLKLYNMKLIGCKGVTYDRMGSSGTHSIGDGELFYWLEKIDHIKKMIEINYKIICEKISFISFLNDYELMIFNNIVDKQSHLFESVKKSSVKRVRQNISRKWMLLYISETH